MIMPREGHHVRLTIIPTAFSDPSRDITHDPEAFHETYSGSLTDNLGPLASNLDELSEKANIFKYQMRSSARVALPGSWAEPQSHSLNVLRSPWYSAIALLQDSFHHTSGNFFRRRLG